MDRYAVQIQCGGKSARQHTRNVLDEAAAACEQFTANGETVVRLGEIVAADGDARVDLRGRLDLSW